MEVVLLFGLIIGLMLIGVPIAFALGLSSIAFLLLQHLNLLKESLLLLLLSLLLLFLDQLKECLLQLS